uniref:Uncharacterized protein n=1 Tax=Brugia timori TaxID=42155 RepID=A0A0R3QC17_9BILA
MEKQEFIHQLKETHQKSCQNRNNLSLLIKWLSISNPTLATKLILQRNDLKELMEIGGGPLQIRTTDNRKNRIQRRFNKINTELEILTQNHETINPITHEMKDEIFWQEISEEAEKIIERMEREFYEIVLPIEEEFEDVIIHWKLISICIIMVTILTVLVILK